MPSFGHAENELENDNWEQLNHKKFPFVQNSEWRWERSGEVLKIGEQFSMCFSMTLTKRSGIVCPLCCWGVSNTQGNIQICCQENKAKAKAKASKALNS